MKEKKKKKLVPPSPSIVKEFKKIKIKAHPFPFNNE